jgi:formylglycine-generating enzyme required for sulfatase activity
MVWCPPGEFMMGSPKSEPERQDREGQQHRVTLSRGFWLGKYAVTQAQWKAVMGSNPSAFTGDDRLPVENVSWNDCQEFLERLSLKGEDAFRLPSETEWEYACRAGTITPFHFGETLSTDLANYDGNYTYANGKKGAYREKTVPVGSFPPNAWGLHDMHGNVWEWCQDWYHDSYAGAPTDGSARENPKGDYRVLRGGSWSNLPGFCRAAFRYLVNPDLRFVSYGFRLSRTP